MSVEFKNAACLKGTRAAQPAASAANEGALYMVSDEGNHMERSNGSSWDAEAFRKYTRTFTIDGGGVVLTTGFKGCISIPVTGRITKVRVLSTDAAGPASNGSIVVDLWKDTYANYPPTVADTITASAKPTISASNKYEDSTLTGWTVTVTAGDVIAIFLDSVSGFTRVTVELEITI